MGKEWCESAAELVTSSMVKALAAHVPDKTLTRKRGKPFWWSKGVEEGMENRKKLHSEWRAASGSAQGPLGNEAQQKWAEHALLTTCTYGNAWQCWVPGLISR